MRWKKAQCDAEFEVIKSFAECIRAQEGEPLGRHASP